MPVMVKDLVRLRPDTVQLWNGKRWTQATGWNQSANDLQALELVLRSGERIGCTGSHLWPTQRGLLATRDLKVGDILGSCVLPEPEGAQRPPYLTDDALWLIGLYLAEGSRSDDTIQIALHRDEMGWLSRLEAIAAHYGGHCTHDLDGDSLAVRLYGRLLLAMIDTYIAPGTAHIKHLKVAAWALPNKSLRLLLIGYLDGDGHYDAANNRIRLGFTRNYQLERDLRTAAARLGATITLQPVIVPAFDGSYPSFRGEWRWTRSGHWNERDRSEIVEIRASRARQFWDIGVEDDPHLFSLASGILTHNSKPNPMPESVRDRPTKAHEYVFLLSKSEHYYYDAGAIREPFQTDPKENYPVRSRITGRGDQGAAMARGNDRGKSGGFPPRPAAGWHQGTRAEGSAPRDRRLPGCYNGSSFTTGKTAATKPQSGHGSIGKGPRYEHEGRNRRSVWTISTKPFKGAHFATFPPKLIEPCVLAGCPEGGVVLDPFAGAFTTALVCQQLGRDSINIELNRDYIQMGIDRLGADLKKRGELFTQQPEPLVEGIA
jgi:hypothetical protein